MLDPYADAALFSASLRQLGLSRADAATRLGASAETIRSWETCRRSVPESTWEQVRALEDAQDMAVADHVHACEAHPDGDPDPWQIAVAARVRRAVPGLQVVLR